LNQLSQSFQAYFLLAHSVEALLRCCLQEVGPQAHAYKYTKSFPACGQPP